jgi:hypothetical protein
MVDHCGSSSRREQRFAATLRLVLRLCQAALHRDRAAEYLRLSDCLLLCGVGSVTATPARHGLASMAARSGRRHDTRSFSPPMNTQALLGAECEYAAVSQRGSGACSNVAECVPSHNLAQYPTTDEAPAARQNFITAWV